MPARCPLTDPDDLIGVADRAESEDMQEHQSTGTPPPCEDRRTLDDEDVLRCARVARRIHLVERAGSAAMTWARVACLLAVPLAVITGVPHDLVTGLLDAIGGGS
jgi:hypothetical protein